MTHHPHPAYLSVVRTRLSRFMRMLEEFVLEEQAMADPTNPPIPPDPSQPYLRVVRGAAEPPGRPPTPDAPTAIQDQEHLSDDS